MSSISERADRFVQKVFPQNVPDNRTRDEKLAEFSKEFDPMNAMKKARGATRKSDAK